MRKTWPGVRVLALSALLVLGATLPGVSQVPVTAGDAPRAAAGPDGAPAGPDGTSAATILVAGDIATCTGSGDRATARLIDDIPGIVMTAGDNVYPSGTPSQFRDCYDPTWGRFLDRTRPALGNHDWATAGAAGYFGYFGRRAGPARRGYYAFNAGTWRIYVMDSTRCYFGGDASSCGRGSAQWEWLKADLLERPRSCVMAVWHHPRYSSGSHGNSRKVRPLMKLLYDAGAEIVVNGHDHIYERFAPARPDGRPDPTGGIRQFIVGTGGGGRYALRPQTAVNSVVRDNSSYGVLRLDLDESGYAWRFLRVDGRPGDAGTGTCHPAAS